MTRNLPIVFIGGLGGSGTRAVAGAMEALGFYPGGCRNGANDNLIFTELFKRPRWIRGGATAREIDQRLALFERIMTGGVGVAALLGWPRLWRFRACQGAGLAGAAGAVGWMTKEPNCHIFAEAILRRWPEAAFVHVARHPLDMAFSDNKAQLGNWGWLFGLDPDRYDSREAAQLEYWIRTQRRLDELITAYPGRIHMVSFEDFTAAPEPVLADLVDRLDLPVDRRRIPDAVRDVIRPDSVGRWRRRDLNLFSPEQLAFCRAAGWPIEREIDDARETG